MKYKKIRFLAILVCITVFMSGCGVVEITDENRSTAALSKYSDTETLFDNWAPIGFPSGETLDYNFELYTGEYIVNGRFTLSVSEKAPSGLHFNWRFIIGKETKKGSCSGDVDKFLTKIQKFCEKDSVTAIIFETLFLSYSNANLYNQFVAQNDNIEVGFEWSSTISGVDYTYSIEDIETYGGIGGFTVLTCEDGIPMQSICISPYISLPSMVMYFFDTDSNNDNYVICELTGAIL